MIGIVVALKSEAESLIPNILNSEKFYIAKKECYKGTLCGKNVILVISGIGKVNAALSTQMLIDRYSVDFILNFGTCGGMNSSVEILKYYAIDECVQFDFDLRELDGVPLGYIQDYKRVFFPADVSALSFLPVSKVASADRFTNAVCDINAINECGASLRDMEGGAIAQVCLSNGVTLLMIKGITDVYNSGTAEEQFYRNLKSVSAGFAEVVMKAINAYYENK